MDLGIELWAFSLQVLYRLGHLLRLWIFHSSPSFRRCSKAEMGAALALLCHVSQAGIEPMVKGELCDEC